jgi:hypothetical protein
LAANQGFIWSTRHYTRVMVSFHQEDLLVFGALEHREFSLLDDLQRLQGRFRGLLSICTNVVYYLMLRIEVLLG